MKKAVNIFLLTFYLFGIFVLPLGDFSVLKDLPTMFQQCKATEDEDLNVFEFLTEHVSGIGQLVEGIEHQFEDEEEGDKPHAPIQFQFEQQQIVCTQQQVKTPVLKPIRLVNISHVVNDEVYISDYISKIFRPPIA